MRLRQCTIDSSCLINLEHLNLIPTLSFLFSSVLLPKAVRRELFRRTATKDRIRSLLRKYAFLQKCNDYDEVTVNLHLAARSAAGIKDRGEIEAVVQAAQIGTMVVVDDPWGRELAAKYALDHHGTIWLLEQFHDLRLISASALRSNLILLRNQKARLPWVEVNALLIKLGEQPI